MDNLGTVVSFMESIITKKVNTYKNKTKEENKQDKKGLSKDTTFFENFDLLNKQFIEFNKELKSMGKMFKGFNSSKRDNNIDNSLFSNRDSGKINDTEFDMQIAGISKRKYSESVVLNKTVVGVAVTWLYKQLTKRKLTGNNDNSDNSLGMTDIAGGLIGAKAVTSIVGATGGLLSKLAVPILGFLGTWILPALAGGLATYGIFKYFKDQKAHASGGVLGGSEKGLAQDIKDAINAPVADFSKENEKKLYLKLMEDKNITALEASKLTKETNNMLDKLEQQIKQQAEDVKTSKRDMDAFIIGLSGRTITQEQEAIKNQKTIALEWNTRDKNITETQANLLEKTETRIQEKNAEVNKKIDNWMGTGGFGLGTIKKKEDVDEVSWVSKIYEELKDAIMNPFAKEAEASVTDSFKSIRSQNEVEFVKQENQITKEIENFRSVRSQNDIEMIKHKQQLAEINKKLENWEGNGGFGLGGSIKKINKEIETSLVDNFRSVRSQNDMASVLEGQKIAETYNQTNVELESFKVNFSELNKLFFDFIKKLKDESNFGDGSFLSRISSTIKTKYDEFREKNKGNKQNPDEIISPQTREIIAGSIAEASLKITEKYEGGGRYWAVNKNDAGSGVSLGKSQVNADRARQMLLAMRGKSLEEKEFFDNIMGNDMAQKMQNKWTNRKGNNVVIFSDEDARNFKTLMQDKKMQSIQDDIIRRDALSGIKKAKDKYGITDERAQAFYADLMHQYGEGGANKNQFLRYGKDLDSIYKASLTGEYNQRRTGVYNDLKNIVISPEKINNENIEKKEINTRPDPDLLLKKISDGINSLVENAKKYDKTENKTETINSSGSSVNIVAVPKHIMSMVFGLNSGGESNNFNLV